MQYYMATCGDDCKTKFWDIRNTQQPLKELTDHSHWYVMFIMTLFLGLSLVLVIKYQASVSIPYIH